MTVLPLSKTYRRVIQLELNEVTAAVLDRLRSERRVPCFAALDARMGRIVTRSESVADRSEPWIQWPSVHTGLSLDQHNVFRLGERPPAGVAQTWEVLSAAGRSSAVIAPLNGRRGATRDGLFIPDPWGSLGDVHPPTAVPLWETLHRLVRRHSPRQVHASELVGAVERAIGAPLSRASVDRCRAEFDLAAADPSQRWRVASALDLVLFAAFEHLLEANEHAYYTLYLNSIAHYQHHFWRQFDPAGFSADVRAPDCAPGDDPMRHGYAAVDEIVGRLLSRVLDADTLLLVVTGLSQAPLVERDEEGGTHHHRVRDHGALLAALGLRGVTAHPLMSRDWRIESDSPESLSTARALLSSMTISGEPLFEVVDDRTGGLFVWTATERAHAKEAEIRVGSRLLGTFDDWLVVSAIKTGKHVGDGLLWCSDLAARAVSEVPVTAIHPTVLRALCVA